MCTQESSPRKTFGNPADLVNKFVHLVGLTLLIPHHSSFRFAVWVGPLRGRGNEGRGV
jgi:hypothetical protein